MGQNYNPSKKRDSTTVPTRKGRGYYGDTKAFSDNLSNIDTAGMRCEADLLHFFIMKSSSLIRMFLYRINAGASRMSKFPCVFSKTKLRQTSTRCNIGDTIDTL